MLQKKISNGLSFVDVYPTEGSREPLIAQRTDRIPQPGGSFPTRPRDFFSSRHHLATPIEPQDPKKKTTQTQEPEGRSLRIQVENRTKALPKEAKAKKAADLVKEKNLEALTENRGLNFWASNRSVVAFPKGLSNEKILIPFTLSVADYATERCLSLLGNARTTDEPFLGVLSLDAQFSEILDDMAQARHYFQGSAGPRTRQYAKAVFAFQERLEWTHVVMDAAKEQDPDGFFASILPSAIANAATFGRVDAELGHTIPWLSEGLAAWIALDATGWNQTRRIAFDGIVRTEAASPEKSPVYDKLLRAQREEEHRVVLLDVAAAGAKEIRKLGEGGVLGRRLYVTLKRDFTKTDVVDYFVSLALVDYLVRSRRTEWNKFIESVRTTPDWRVAWIGVFGQGSEAQAALSTLSKMEDSRECEKALDLLFRSVTETVEADLWKWAVDRYKAPQKRTPPYQPGVELISKQK